MFLLFIVQFVMTTDRDSGGQIEKFFACTLENAYESDSRMQRVSYKASSVCETMTKNGEGQSVDNEKKHAMGDYFWN